MDFRSNFGLILASNFLYFHDFFGIDFRIVFCSLIFHEKGSQNGPKLICSTPPFSYLFRDLFRRLISVACGNSSAPGPREDNLHAKICKKFDARVNAGVFFANFCLKRWISPKTRQNETPRVRNNQNVALNGTKRASIWATRAPKWAQRVPKGRQKWTQNQQIYHQKSRPWKRSKKGGQGQHLFRHFWFILVQKYVQKSMRKTVPEKA